MSKQADIGAVVLDGNDVPVKLRAHGSLFVNVNARPEDNGGLWRLTDTD